MTRLRPDLLVTVTAAATAALVVALVPGLPAVRTPFALVLLLALPGYSLTAALFDEQSLDAWRRLLLTVALSLAASVMVGLVLNLMPFGLRAASWAVALLAVVCAACAVAARRGGRPAVWPATPGQRLTRVNMLFLLGAVLLLGGAIGFARMPLSATSAQGYTALWLAPRGTDFVRVGVKSGELHARTYRLVVRADAGVALDRRLTELPPGGSFTATVRLNKLRARSVVARLYVNGSVYRVTRLWRTG
jgi:Protein of unknown function (DUF1616)